MKECVKCGAQMTDESLFCTECGSPIPKNVCHNCGADINEGDAFCTNCGKKLDLTIIPDDSASMQKHCPNCGVIVDKESVFCESCGTKVGTSQIYEESNHHNLNGGRGSLIIRWGGRWTIIDARIRVMVNGSCIGEYSFKDGFEISVPITTDNILVETKLSFHKTKSLLNLETDGDYIYNLVYNTLSGGLGYVLCDKAGNELEKDKLHWGYSILCFIIPIIGLIYALSVWKNKRASAKSALTISLLGAIVWFFVSNYTSNIRNLMESRNTDKKMEMLEQSQDSIEEAYVDEPYVTKNIYYKKTAPTDNFDVEVEINVDYPQKGNPDLVQNISKFVVDVLYNDFKNDVERPSPLYRGDFSDGQSIVNFYGKDKIKELKEQNIGSAAISIIKTYETDRIVSYTVDFGGDNGGVGLGCKFGATFDKHYGHRIEVFANPTNSLFLEYLFDEILKNIPLDDVELIDESELRSHPYPQYAPYITKDGVCFNYQKYEIGPGEVEVTIPFVRMSDYMTENARSVVDCSK